MAMNSIITHVYDLTAPLGITPLRHHLVSGDQMADRFDVTVTERGQDVPLSGAGVTGFFIREADHYTVLITGSASGNVASVMLPEVCYAVPGRFTLTVKVSAGGVRHAVAVFDGAVLRSSTDVYIDPGHNIPDLQDLLDQIARMEQATGAATAATATANAAAGSANSAAGAANAAAGSANSAAAYVRGVTVSAHPVAPGGAPTAAVSDVGGHMHVDFGIVKGDKGDRGDVGPIGTIDNLLVNGKASADGRIDLTAADIPGARAVNLLENSNFTNFIAQEGIGGLHGTQAYACDLWKLISGSAELVSGVGLKLNGTMEQVVSRPIPSPRTVVIHTASGEASWSVEGNALRISAAGAVLLDAALYAGSISGDVPYQPRSYVEELLNCFRCYYVFAGVVQPVGLVSGQHRFYLRMPVQMRATPTITMTGYGSYADPPAISDANANGAMLYKSDYWALSRIVCSADR